VECDRVEEINDLDPVPRRLEAPPELLGRAVVTRAHGRGDDEDAPAHEGTGYRPDRMAAVLLALGAALAYAAASVLQQREAEADTGSDQGGTVGGGFRLVLRLARRPIWLAGLGADGVGYVFQALALGVGELLVVQPVLTSGILFALPAGAWWSGRRLGRADFAWAFVLAAGLTAFLLLAGTDGGQDFASPGAWLVCAAIAAPILVVAMLLGTRSRGTRRAVLFAFTTGALFGITAALTKASVVLIDHEGFGTLGHWEPYALVVLGALGFVVNQRAFQAGSLTASLPTLTVVEPIVAALIGVTMLHETVPTEGALEWIAVAVSVVAMIVATVVLSRSAARHDLVHEHELADVLTRAEREG
jgi:drug/metabolite transporter (DMT)-like permease